MALEENWTQQDMKNKWTLARPRRRDATALAFGLGFLAFGALGLLGAAGLDVPTQLLVPAILILFGAATLMSLVGRTRRKRRA